MLITETFGSKMEYKINQGYSQPVMATLKNILYVSNLCSPRLMEYIFNTSSIKPGLQVQKFHRLIVEGLSVQDEPPFELDILSAIPVIPGGHKKRFWNLSKEVIENIHYGYVPMINMRFIKSISIFVNSFIKIFFWNLSGTRKGKVVYCDVLKLAVTVGALCACKLTGTKMIAIVTDIPGMIVSNSVQKKTLEYKIHNTLRLKILSSYNGYVFLTEKMNDLINCYHKPYIVMEGLVDIKMNLSENRLYQKDTKRILIYAGLIYEEYGVKKLIEAFMQIPGDDLRLHIYGDGEMKKDMPYYSGVDKRIVYQGIVPNHVIVQKQIEATLLINPRPSTSEFTKYSFPSKNMEYMVSGTPLVTTPLPGMPEEYNQFVYLLNDESIEGISSTLKLLLLKSNIELNTFGHLAKQFVISNKNNIIQAKRLLNLSVNIC